MTARVIIGLGSNQDDPARQLALAVAALRTCEHLSEVRRAGVYRSPALSGPGVPAGQDDYLNTAVGARTALAPAALLAELKSLEAELGREPGPRWGPRRIDLDLLLYDDAVLRAEGLELPHPGIAERAFVLQPLLDLEPEAVVPGRGGARELLAALDQALVTVEAMA